MHVFKKENFLQGLTITTFCCKAEKASLVYLRIDCIQSTTKESFSRVGTFYSLSSKSDSIQRQLLINYKSSEKLRSRLHIILKATSHTGAMNDTTIFHSLTIQVRTLILFFFSALRLFSFVPVLLSLFNLTIHSFFTLLICRQNDLHFASTEKKFPGELFARVLFNFKN